MQNVTNCNMIEKKHKNIYYVTVFFELFTVVH